jgi:hypothetical protein
VAGGKQAALAAAKFFKLWQEEQKACRDPHKAIVDPWI